MMMTTTVVVSLQQLATASNEQAEGAPLSLSFSPVRNCKQQRTQSQCPPPPPSNPTQTLQIKLNDHNRKFSRLGAGGRLVGRQSKKNNPSALLPQKRLIFMQHVQLEPSSWVEVITVCENEPCLHQKVLVRCNRIWDYVNTAVNLYIIISRVRLCFR